MSAPLGPQGAERDFRGARHQDSRRRALGSDTTQLAEGQLLMQGYVGAALFTKLERTDVPGVDGAQDLDLEYMPLIGGGGMWVMNESALTLGPELGFNFAFRSSGGAFVSGSGGAVVAVDIDISLLELYAGMAANVFLGRKWRIYAGAGPLVQFADYEQTGGTLAADGTGFGLGYYGRTGLEYMLPNRWMVGVGGRWMRSTVDLSDDLGDLEVEGTQVYVSVTSGF